MARFNVKKRTQQLTVNRAGGEAYTQDPRLELASILLTSFAQDQYYRSSEQTFAELADLLTRIDPLFAAKAAVYARTEFGLRSITHVLAAELALHASGKPWAKAFYDRIVKRPDDMLEIAAYYFGQGGTTLPNAMKKGFAVAFDRFDGYQLAKYRGERKSVTLVDLVNLVHPVPTRQNAQALQALVADELRNTQTWETKLTRAGQEAGSEEDKAERKAEAWAELIAADKLGYFALLRNLRNIAEQAPELIDPVCTLLTDEKRIRQSLVLPFRFITAFDAVNEADVEGKRQLLDALNQALELSLANVPVFPGRTLVVLDDSGSMTWAHNKEGVAPIRIGAIFAAMLFKSNNADLMRFSDDASYVRAYHRDSVATIANNLVKNARSAGTNFHAIFQQAANVYDRIIILSDMQGWMGHASPAKDLTEYKRRKNADPHIYSIDLQGYGTLQFPERNVYALAGVSDKVFSLMRLLEEDRQVLVNKIESIAI